MKKPSPIPVKKLTNREQKGAYSSYFRDCPYEKVDIYRILQMFDITDQAIGHAIKKLMLAGVRTGAKSTRQDIEEAIVTLQRRLEMMDEE